MTAVLLCPLKEFLKIHFLSTSSPRLPLKHVARKKKEKERKMRKTKEEQKKRFEKREGAHRFRNVVLTVEVRATPG